MENFGNILALGIVGYAVMRYYKKRSMVTSSGIPQGNDVITATKAAVVYNCGENGIVSDCNELVNVYDANYLSTPD